MKALRILSLAALAAALSLGVAWAQKATTVEGTLVDSACYLKGGETGNDHGAMKECGTMCLKGGTPAGVLTKDKKFHAIIAPSTALAGIVGQTVRVTGANHNGSLLAEKVEVNKNGKWEAVKLGAMM
jgi:hypothetical protein